MMRISRLMQEVSRVGYKGVSRTLSATSEATVGVIKIQAVIGIAQYASRSGHLIPKRLVSDDKCA
jgi:hypothetical protein